MAKGIQWPTRLDRIKIIHSPDSIATENSGTRGRSIWVHLSQVGLLDNGLPRSLLERVGRWVRAVVPELGAGCSVRSRRWVFIWLPYGRDCLMV